MAKLIGYARVSTRDQSTDRQQVDLLTAGVERDDLYIDHGVSGARASRPEFDRALEALIAGDTLVITTLDRLGRSTQNMLAFAEELRTRGAGGASAQPRRRRCRYRHADEDDALHHHGSTCADGTRHQTRAINRLDR